MLLQLVTGERGDAGEIRGRERATKENEKKEKMKVKEKEKEDKKTNMILREGENKQIRTEKTEK